MGEAEYENEWDESTIDRQASERGLTRGQTKGEEGGERGVEEVNRTTLVRCSGTRAWKRTKVQTGKNTREGKL